MPLRRTERSDGRQRPRWKDGSYDLVENTDANESQCEDALEANLQVEQLVDAPPLLARSHEHQVPTRDRPARMAAASGEIIEMAPAEVAKLRAAVEQPVIDRWVADVTAKGIDGKALVAEARQLISKYSQ